MKIDFLQLVLGMRLLTLRQGMYERKTRMPPVAPLKASAAGLAFAFCIKRVVHDEFAFENFVIA